MEFLRTEAFKRDYKRLAAVTRIEFKKVLGQFPSTYPSPTKGGEGYEVSAVPFVISSPFGKLRAGSAEESRRFEKARPLDSARGDREEAEIRGNSGIPIEVWEARVTLNYQMTFEVHGSILLLRRVGTHDVLRSP